MAQPRKKRSLMEVVTEGKAALSDLLITQPRIFIAQAREKMRDLPKTNFDLGREFIARGLWRDALFRFQIVHFLQPAYPRLSYFRGCCQYRLGRMNDAKASLLAALRESPGDEDVIYMLALADPASLPPGVAPQRLNSEFVREFFAQAAAGFTAFEAQNNYQGGKAVAEALKPHLQQTQGLLYADLGCGTGIASIMLRPSAGGMLGVDFCAQMLKEAAGTTMQGMQLFAATCVGDLHQPDTWLKSVHAPAMPGEYHVAVCVNVASYLGDLAGMFQAASLLLMQGGLFAISYEPAEAAGGSGIVLRRDTARFAHSAPYVAQMAAAAGFLPVSESSVALYPDSSSQLAIFRKGTA